jgi:hypothetical protein
VQVIDWCAVATCAAVLADAFDISEHAGDSVTSAGGHPHYTDATTSVQNFDMEAQASFRSSSSSSPTGDGLGATPQKQRRPTAAVVAKRSGHGGAAVVLADGTSTISVRTLQALLSWRQRSGDSDGLREPLLLRIEESPANTSSGQHGGEQQGGGAEVDTTTSSHTPAPPPAAAQAAPAGAAEGSRLQAVSREGAGLAVVVRRSSGPGRQRRGSASSVGSSTSSSVQAQAGLLPCPPAFADAGQGASDTPSLLLTWPQQQEYEPAAAARHFAAHGRRTFSEGMQLHLPPEPEPAAEPAADSSKEPAAAAHTQTQSPQAAAPDSVLVGGPYCARCVSCNTPGPVVAGLPGSLATPPSPLTLRRSSTCGTSDHPHDAALSPHWQSLQQQHMAEQVQLLEQQAAEQVAMLAAADDEQLKGPGTSLKHRLQHPLVLLLSCTMPRVSRGEGDWGLCCVKQSW